MSIADRIVRDYVDPGEPFSGPYAVMEGDIREWCDEFIGSLTCLRRIVDKDRLRYAMSIIEELTGMRDWEANNAGMGTSAKDTGETDD